MKRIVSLLVVLAMILSMASTVFAVGDYDDPEIITELGEYTVSAPAGYWGYHLSYTADKSGMLTLTLADDEDNYYITIMNQRTHEEVSCDSDFEVSSAGVEIAVGDTVSINVMACDYTEEDITFTLSLDEYEVEVYVQLDLYEDEYSFPCYSEQIPAGGSVKYKVGDMLGGGMMTVTGEDAYVEIEGETLLPNDDGVIFIDFTQFEGEPVQGWFNVTYYYDMYIGNNGTEDAWFEIGYWFPEGAQSNPKPIEAGVTYECTIAEGDEGGYFYVFNAPADCVVTVTVEGDDNWCYQLYNLGSYSMGDWQYDFDGAPNTDSIIAYEGDPIRVQVGAMDEYWEYPGGTFTVTVTYEEVDIYPGSKYLPINISAYYCPMTIELEAGKSAFFKLDGFATYNANYDFVMVGEGSYLIMDGVKYEAENGVLTVPITEGDMIVEIGNSSDSDAVYEIANPFPLGNSNNPHVIELDKEYELEFSADDSTYCMEYTAEVGGMLTIHILSESGWKYIMSSNYYWGSNNSTGSQYYAKDPAYYEYSIELPAGYTATAYIGTNDGTSYYGDFIDGTVKVMYTFKPHLTEGENVVEIEQDDADGDTWTFVAEQDGILDISVTNISLYDTWGDLIDITSDELLPYFTRNGGNFHLSVNGNDILNPSQQLMVYEGDVVTISLHSAKAVWAEITLDLTVTPYEYLDLGDNEFAVDGNGGYYVFMPEADGDLTIEFTELYIFDDIELSWMPCMPIDYASEVAGLTVNGEAIVDHPATISVEAGVPVVISLCHMYGFEIEGSLNLSMKTVETIYELPYTLEAELTEDDCEEGAMWKFTATQSGVIIGHSENINDLDAWVTVYVNGEPFNLMDGVVVYEGDEVVFNLVALEAGYYSCELSWMELVMGDVNFDGEIDTKDANLVCSYYNELLELSDLALALADVNGDGEIDTKDANLICSFYNELIDKFPIEE